MPVQFKSQTGVQYLSTTALTWYGDYILLIKESSWNMEALALEISSSWGILTDFDRQASWGIFHELTPESSWKILNDISNGSSWSILTDFDKSSSWDILLGFEIDSSWNLQGIRLYFPGIDAKATPVAVNFKAFLKRELNIKAPKVYNFYNRTEKLYEFRALRQIKRK